MGAQPQTSIGKLNSKNGMLSYPNDIFDSPYACILRFSEYNRDISYNPGTLTPSATIVLPLPTSLQEAQNITHGPETFTRTGTALAAIRANKQGQDISSLLKDNAISLGAEFSREIGGLVSRLAKTDVGLQDAATIANAVQGQMLNPHLTAIFQGVQLRNFNYSWKFAPRSEIESLDLKKILDLIRRSSLPRFVGGQISLKYPDEVQIDFIGNGIEKFVIGTKRTVITSVSIDHSAGGSTAFYKSGAPTHVDFGITLQEVAIRTAEDYDYPLFATQNPGRDN